MSFDTRALSPAMWGDISGEGTSNEGVRVNFPGLGSRPSLSSSRVSVLGSSLQKLAVIMVAVLPGQSQQQRPCKDVNEESREWSIHNIATFLSTLDTYYCNELCFQTSKMKNEKVLHIQDHTS